MTLRQTIEHYAADFLSRYGHRLRDEHRHALAAMRRCRTEANGQLHWQCPSCDYTQNTCRSCGHRSCQRCQNHDNTRWLERQHLKLLPVDYFMVTFTLPAECRGVAWANQRQIYALLIQSAVSTCRDFASRDKQLHGEIGQSAVLHTQTRRLDYHPHVHLIIPGGAIDAAGHRWRTPKGKFLFSHKALAAVFRARMLEGMRRAALLPQKSLPATWVVDCRAIGNGLPALKYLARYLYRGVISETQLVGDDGDSVTFRYRDAKTQQWTTRTVEGAHFLWLLIQHVLPRGFRCVRDYGFLHGNAWRKLIRIQWFLKVSLSVTPPQPRPVPLCPQCTEPMRIIRISLPIRLSG